MGRLGTWIEERLGLSLLTGFGKKYLEKPVPPHVNYAFTLGTVALVLFMTQVGSGLLLSLNYSAAIDSAYPSVQRITYEISGGWLIRSFHAWGAHAMIFILMLHMLRVFWYGGYKKPREMTWIFGCGLLFLTLIFGFTGYLLPMDQVSYWGTVVGTEPFFKLPLVGDLLGEIVRGGQYVTDATVSRFYILHVFVLPASVAGLVGLHLYLVGRLGISTRESTKTETERGYQNLMNESGIPFHKHMVREVTTVAIVLGAVITLAVLFPFGLHEAATPDHTPRGVKPEWYFLPAYQLLKYFPKLLGLLLVNGAIVALVMLPFIDRNPERLPSRRRFMLAAAAAALLVTLALGLLGWLSEQRIGNWEFDMQGIPHQVE